MRAALALTLAGVFLELGCQAIAGFEDFEAAGASGGGGTAGGSSHAGSSAASSGSPGGGDSSRTAGDAGQAATGGGQSGGSGQAGACTGGSWGAHPEPEMIQIEGADGHCYWMDKTEVSRAEYRDFLDDVGSNPEQAPPCDWNSTLIPDCEWPGAAGAGGGAGEDASPDPTLPVTCVDWCDAAAYCRWAEKRLCDGSYANSTDARQSEWYSACSDGGVNTYPYGDDYHRSICNGVENPMHDSPSDAALRPVDSQTSCVTPDGILNLSGNAAEWVDECDDTGDADDYCDGTTRVTATTFGGPCAVCGDGFTDSISATVEEWDSVTQTNTRGRPKSVKKICVDELVTDYMGYRGEQCQDLLDRMEPGDELWVFASSRESWENLAGCAGIALVRDGEVVYETITMIS